MWLVKREVLQAMRAARSAGYEPSNEERAAFATAMREAYASNPSDRPHIMSVSEDTAEIVIEGVLTEKPDCWALMFGGGNATYEAIRKSLALADADPSVKKIVLNIASPGGHVNGLFETFAALDAVQKPIEVRSNFAASAAFGIAAVAGKIIATSPAAEFGSIGVAASFYVDDDQVDIASTDAPRKRPDVRTEEGIAMVREELDQLHELFADRIARGRSHTTGETVTAKMVNADFGMGGMFVAGTAKKRGMIDSIAAQPKRTRPGGRGSVASAFESNEFQSIARVGDSLIASDGTGQQFESTDGTTWTVRAAPVAHVGDTITTGGASVVGAEKINEPPAIVAEAPATTNASAKLGGAEQPKETIMNKDELKSQHPELFAAVLAEGTETERKRVLDHIKLGTASGANEAMLGAITSGASVVDCLADYHSASMKRDATKARQEETDAAGAAADGATGAAPVKSTAEEVDRLVGEILAGKVKL